MLILIIVYIISRTEIMCVAARQALISLTINDSSISNISRHTKSRLITNKLLGLIIRIDSQINSIAKSI